MKEYSRQEAYDIINYGFRITKILFDMKKYEEAEKYLEKTNKFITIYHYIPKIDNFTKIKNQFERVIKKEKSKLKNS